MKREIKFRAWDEGNKVMHFDFQDNWGVKSVNRYWQEVLDAVRWL
jgi:hypothetical protein